MTNKKEDKEAIKNKLNKMGIKDVDSKNKIIGHDDFKKNKQEFNPKDYVGKYCIFFEELYERGYYRRKAKKHFICKINNLLELDGELFYKIEGFSYFAGEDRDSEIIYEIEIEHFSAKFLKVKDIHKKKINLTFLSNKEFEKEALKINEKMQ
jgi:hypothetical protein